MLPDRVSNPGPLTYESGALPIALRGPALRLGSGQFELVHFYLSLLFFGFKCLVFMCTSK